MEKIIGGALDEKVRIITDGSIILAHITLSFMPLLIGFVDSLLEDKEES